MSFNELMAMYSLIVTSCISLLTICVNIRLSKRSLSNNRKIRNYDQHREALIKFYLPLKFQLIKLECLLKEDDEQYFDMFNLYADDIQNKKRRENIIKEYTLFLNEFRTYTLFFTNENIDMLINAVYQHIIIILLADQKVLSIQQYKEQYAMPQLSNVIKMIDRYSKRYETYRERTVW